MAVLKKLLCTVMCAGLFTAFLTFTASAQGNFNTYTYSNTGDIVFSPDLYDVENVISGSDMGVGSLDVPADMCVDGGGRLYIADTGNNSIVIYDTALKKARRLSEFKMPDGSISSLNEPQGIYSRDGLVYICDTGNNRLLCSDISGNVKMEVLKPDSSYFTDGIEFIPKRLTVDSAGNIYVSAIGAYQGLSLFSPEGEFIGFYGAEEVEATADVLKDYVWKQFMTEEQRDIMASYVPPEACNIYSNSRDFILTIANSYYIPNTSEKSEMDSIRLLNPKGVNTITLDASKYPGSAIAADAKYLNFVAGCVDADGFVMLLDNSANKIFQFDSEMNLLGVFGGNGTENGRFITPADIDILNDRLYVLDAGNGTVTEYNQTEYGALIHNALVVYNTSEQTEAIDLWHDVLKYNANYDLAYVGIGRALLNSGNAKEAMRYFELGHDSGLYNEAFSVRRTEVLRRYGVIVAAVILVMAAAVSVLKRKRVLRPLPQDGKLGYVSALGYAVRHPFAGFERLRSGKKLSLILSFVCTALFMFLNLFKIQFTGKQFNMVNINEINLLWEMLGSLLILLIWTVSNWCFSVLIEGKATFKEIFITSSYCLIPYTVACYIRVILSNFLVRQEDFFSLCIVIVGTLWSITMLIAAFSYFHEFEGMQIFKAIFLTLLGMAIIAILIFVVYMLIQQLVSTVLVVFNEFLFGVRTNWR